MFQGNSAEYGGGLEAWGNELITDSTFSGNRVAGPSGEGGAINNDGTLTVTNTTIDANGWSGTGSLPSTGGGITNQAFADLTVINSTITGNRATSGGGIYVVPERRDAQEYDCGKQSRRRELLWHDWRRWT